MSNLQAFNYAIRITVYRQINVKPIAQMITAKYSNDAIFTVREGDLPKSENVRACCQWEVTDSFHGGAVHVECLNEFRRQIAEPKRRDVQIIAPSVHRHRGNDCPCQSAYMSESQFMGDYTKNASSFEN